MNRSLKVVQLVKTSDGASWAINQVKELCKQGLSVDILLNDDKGKLYHKWTQTGANIHIINTSLRPNPFKLLSSLIRTRKLIKKIAPDIVHSHFLTNTIFIRMALIGTKLPIVFQVPGPLHLEHIVFKMIDLMTATKKDYWIASSLHIKKIYLATKKAKEKVFLSYYGNEYKKFDSQNDSKKLRDKYNFTDEDIVIGNVCYIYPPKKFLLQKSGLKNHETMIKAVALARKTNPKIKGLFIGGQWGNKTNYENQLKRFISDELGMEKEIIITGKIDPDQAASAWGNLDLAIHLPFSESCGGVIEPLLADVPIISCKTGGIPEIIKDQKTGYITSKYNVEEVAQTILAIAQNIESAKSTCHLGRKLVSEMFDVSRTAKEIGKIYKNILKIDDEYTEYDSMERLDEISED